MMGLTLLAGLAVAEDGGLKHTNLILDRRVEPRYPPGQQGAARCLVQVLVDERGRTHEPEARGCPEPFAQTAVQAVKRWRYRYEPPLENDEPGKYPAHAVLSFTRAGVPPLPTPALCEWTLSLQPDGALSILLQAPLPCALWLPPGVVQPPPRPEAPSRCRVLQRSRTERDFTECPEPMHALGEYVLKWSVTAKAEEIVVILVPAP